LESCRLHSFGLENFLLPNKFIEGGATGISLLAAGSTFVPLLVFLVAVNIPFIFLAVKINGKHFAIKKAFAIIALAIVVGPQYTFRKLRMTTYW
jgi:uncharacterized membrane-anchored protein YitT (DUF2179 family)